MTIHGGTVNAIAALGAGIGGGRSSKNSSVTIYGGSITATAKCGAGIGGGDNSASNHVTLYGGSITATSRKGAGIGGGEEGNVNNDVTFKWDATHTSPITLNCAKFTSPRFEGSFMLQETGELADAENIKRQTIVPCRVIRFDGAGAEGEMAAQTVSIGGSAALSECDFTVPECKTFVCWQDADGAEHQPGETFTPTGDLTLTALWLNAQTLSFEGYVETTEEVVDEDGNTTIQTLQDHSAYEARCGDAPFINAVTGANTPVTWQSSDTTVATVDAATGKVTLVDVGEAAIHATAARTDTWAQATAQYTLTVLPRIVDDPTVTVADGGLTYTGAAITPGITVKDGGITVPSDEYTLEWENNVKAGTATVSVTDIPGGRYELAAATAEFEIAPRPVTVTGIAAASKHYDGSTDVELDLSGMAKNLPLLPRFSCHTLRHTFCTNLCAAGVDVKTISEIPGHADVRVTLEIYAEVTKDMKNRAVKSLEDYLNEDD